MQDCNIKVSNSLSTPFEQKSNIPQYKTQTLDANPYHLDPLPSHMTCLLEALFAFRQ
jgi:hypothetical protein